MNENLKYGLIFLGGLAVGALGVMAAKRDGKGLKPVATELLSRGMDVKDVVMGKMETIKENVEDLVAEAHHAAEQRREQRESSASNLGAE